MELTPFKYGHDRRQVIPQGQYFDEVSTLLNLIYISDLFLTELSITDTVIGGKFENTPPYFFVWGTSLKSGKEVQDSVSHCMLSVPQNRFT